MLCRYHKVSPRLRPELRPNSSNWSSWAWGDTCFVGKWNVNRFCTGTDRGIVWLYPLLVRVIWSNRSNETRASFSSGVPNTEKRLTARRRIWMKIGNHELMWTSHANSNPMKWTAGYNYTLGMWKIWFRHWEISYLLSSELDTSLEEVKTRSV